MIDNLRHFFHMLSVSRTLARYRVLELARRAGPLPFGVRTLISLVNFAAGRAVSEGRPVGERLALAFEDLGPAYIKLGQMLATRPDIIGHDIARHLRALQDDLKPFPAAEAKAAIEAEFEQPLTALFAAFEETPVAAASIAQVHRAQTTAGADVAVKVLRPGVERRFARELDFFAWGAAAIERHVPKARRLRPVETIETLARAVAVEMDLRLEAAALSELAENMAGEEGFTLPALDWRRTGSRVLTTSWVDGIALSDAAAVAATGVDTRPLAARLVHIFLKQAMRDGFFHADLHQGNLLLTPAGDIAAVDFGIMGRLTPEDRRYLAEILYGFITRNYTRIAEIHFAAGYVPPQHKVADFAAALRAIGEPILGLPVSQISVGRLLAQLFATTAQFDMPTQPHLLLLQKTMMMIEGLALELDPAVNMWQVSRPVLEEWFAENMSLEAQAADWLVEKVRMAERLPQALRDISRIADAVEQLDTTAQRGTEKLPESQSRLLFWMSAGLALGFIIGALAF